MAGSLVCDSGTFRPPVRPDWIVRTHPARPAMRRSSSTPFREERKTLVVATVGQLAELVRGRLVGDGSLAIRSARPVGEAGPGRYHVHRERAVRQAAPDLARLGRDRRAALHRRAPGDRRQSLAVIEVDDPMAAFLAVRSHLSGGHRPRWTGIHPQASVAPSARIGQDVAIYPFAYVGEDAVIGDGTTLHPGAVIGEGCTLGRDCVIHPNAVLYANVVLGDRVEVHAGTRPGRRRVRLPPRPTAGTSRSRIPGGSRWATTSRSARTARSTAPRSRPPGSARGRRSTTWS